MWQGMGTLPQRCKIFVANMGWVLILLFLHFSLIRRMIAREEKKAFFVDLRNFGQKLV